MGAHLKVQAPGVRQGEKVRIDVGRDRDGEFFDVRCQDGIVPEILDVRPASRHLVLMVRDGDDKNKFLLGRDERHWFAAAVPGDGVHDVRTAIASLRPTEVEGRRAIRQGEWFFAPAPEVHEDARVIYRNEPLSRGGGSKPHICEQMMRFSGTAVRCPRRMSWRRMVRDAQVYARGDVRHRDHKTIHLDGWHRVY